MPDLTFEFGKVHAINKLLHMFKHIRNHVCNPNWIYVPKKVMLDIVLYDYSISFVINWWNLQFVKLSPHFVGQMLPNNLIYDWVTYQFHWEWTPLTMSFRPHKNLDSYVDIKVALPYIRNWNI